MKRQLFRMVAVVGGALLLGVPATAHHSASLKYDPNKPITLQGTVTKVEWTNPHIYFYIDVADERGRVENWAVESGPPNWLYRRGWRRDSLNPGDVVTVEAFAAREPGLRHANSRSVVLADGRRLFSGSNDGLPERTGAQGGRR